MDDVAQVLFPATCPDVQATAILYAMQHSFRYYLPVYICLLHMERAVGDSLDHNLDLGHSIGGSISILVHSVGDSISISISVTRSEARSHWRLRDRESIANG